MRRRNKKILTCFVNCILITNFDALIIIYS